MIGAARGALELHPALLHHASRRGVVAAMPCHNAVIPHITKKICDHGTYCLRHQALAPTGGRKAIAQFAILMSVAAVGDGNIPDHAQILTQNKRPIINTRIIIERAPCVKQGLRLEEFPMR